MTTPYPHCQVQIDIEPESLAALQGHANFLCPSCEGLVPVPPVTRHPVKFTAAAAVRPAKPLRSSAVPSALHGLNRNLLIVGSIALLVLGGLGFFLTSRRSGDSHVASTNI
jgi:hypothetical protein